MAMRGMRHGVMDWRPPQSRSHASTQKTPRGYERGAIDGVGGVSSAYPPAPPCLGFVATFFMASRTSTAIVALV
jgi:hypothetical protein